MADQIGRDSDKFMLRLPDGMRDKIKSVAATNNRSMNAEIIATLQEKYPAYNLLGMASLVLKLHLMDLDKRNESLARMDKAGVTADPQRHEVIKKMFDEVLTTLDKSKAMGEPEPTQMLVEYLIASHQHSVKL